MTIALHPRMLPMLAFLALSACIIPTGPVEVIRTHRAADGMIYGSGSYDVKAYGKSAGLELSPYLAAVAREMQRAGYQEKVVDSDFSAEVSVSRRELKGSDPAGGLQAKLSHIETALTVRILRRIDKLVVWEGTARQSARPDAPAAQPGIAASKLAAALFQDFPGESGATVSVP